ncbi:MAG: DUF4340 domain-containing protein [Chloroflexota bacterium]
MIRRSTWVVLFVFLLLLGVTWFLQRPGTSSETTPSPTSVAFLFSLNAEEVAGFQITDDSGRSVTLVHQEDVWTLLEPPAEDVDQMRVETAINQILSLRPLSNLGDDMKLMLIGLETPQYTIRVQLVSGAEHILYIGDLTPINNGYYSRLVDGSIVVLSKYVVDSLVGLLDQPPIMPTATLLPPTSTSTASPPVTTPLEITPQP